MTDRTRGTPTRGRSPTLRRALAVLALAASAGAAGCGARAARAGVAPVPVSAPRVVALRPEALVRARAGGLAHDTLVAPALAKLLDDAAKALRAPVVAVTDKHTLLPPSDDPHDYFSLSPYWWPDPSKPDGLPYIRRDGETNPESKRDLDQPRVAAMGDNVQTLALAYWFTGEERYAERAARQLRAWFLDPATRMNPHLRYAQLVRGNPNERGSGIIDTRWFIETADAVRLLAGSRSWSAADEQGMRDWFTRYLTWLRTSPNGEHEHAARNNHGSWYAAQAATLALFVGDTATARALAGEGRARIGWQITPAGEQPLELERTRSLHYSAFNVEALSRLAEVGDKVGVELWHYDDPAGGSLRGAIDRLAQFADSAARWPGPQIDSVSTDLFVIHLRRARTVWGDVPYAAELRRLPAEVVRTDRSALLYPDGRVPR